MRALLIGILRVLWGGGVLAAPPGPPVGLPRGAGVNLGFDCCTYVAVQVLEARWWTDYRSANVRIDGPGHVFLVEHQVPPAELTPFAAQHRGAAWTLGNEPNDRTGYGDRCGTPLQCGAIWQVQAAGIRAGDPGALLIGPGLADADPAYAQALVDAGADRFQVWNLHYFTQRADAQDVLARVRAFQAWAHGRGDFRPIMLGETGIWAVPDQFAPSAIRALGTGLPALGVTAWAWFPGQVTTAWPGGLLDAQGHLTPAGHAFRDLNHPAHPVRWRRPSRLETYP